MCQICDGARTIKVIKRGDCPDCQGTGKFIPASKTRCRFCNLPRLCPSCLELHQAQVAKAKQDGTQPGQLVQGHAKLVTDGKSFAYVCVQHTDADGNETGCGQETDAYRTEREALEEWNRAKVGTHVLRRNKQDEPEHATKCSCDNGLFIRIQPPRVCRSCRGTRRVQLTLLAPCPSCEPKAHLAWQGETTALSEEQQAQLDQVRPTESAPAPAWRHRKSKQQVAAATPAQG